MSVSTHFPAESSAGSAGGTGGTGGTGDAAPHLASNDETGSYLQVSTAASLKVQTVHSAHISTWRNRYLHHVPGSLCCAGL